MLKWLKDLFLPESPVLKVHNYSNEGDDGFGMVDVVMDEGQTLVYTGWSSNGVGVFSGDLVRVQGPGHAAHYVVGDDIKYRSANSWVATMKFYTGKKK